VSYRIRVNGLTLVLLVELVDAAFVVEDASLSSEERVRLTGNFHSNQRIFIAVFPLDRVLCSNAGFSKDREVTGDVLENNRTVVIGMNIFLHTELRFYMDKPALIKQI
jgi:hypothetical protein